MMNAAARSVMTCALGLTALLNGDYSPVAAELPRQPVADHLAIEGPFADGADVTDTCLDCHSEAADEVMQTRHWTWSRSVFTQQQGWVHTGKRHAVNNFCYGVASNLNKCTECHVGYGWKDDDFDFDEPSNVDCLVCHDTTGTYRRLGGDGGMADPATDFEFVARHVGPTSRASCGACHFYAGGAHGVKHGDLERALIDGDAQLDVHMAADGLNFGCQDCHVTRHHQIPGRTLSTTPGGGMPVLCTDCHDGVVHADKPVLERHARSVSCQACHIPSYAKGQATKMSWDWSQAGTLADSQPGPDGLPLYVPYKGSFTWQRHVVPDYAWYNGTAGVHAWGEQVDPTQLLRLNWPRGDKSDETAKIHPFKSHRGRQIYDSKHRYLINPHLVTDDGFAYTLDWDSAARLGMQARGLAYSGNYDFVETLMYLRLNHMVAPADQALICRDCHGARQTRLHWNELGYEHDPLYNEGQARFPVTR